MHERRLAGGLVAAGGLFLLWLSIPMFQGKLYVEDDLGAFHIPLRWFYQQCLQAGDSYLWMPSIFNGIYIFGEGQAGMAHPFQYVLYRWLPFTPAFMVNLLAVFPAVFTGMLLFLRRWGVGPAGSAYGAFCFTFIGVNLNHYIHMNSAAIFAHLMWQLLAIDGLLRAESGPGKRAACLAACTLLTASQLLYTSPQYVIISGLIEALYALTLLHGDRQWSAAFGLGLSKAAAAGLGAIQLLPTWDALENSYRAAPGAEFSVSLSMHPLNLFQFFSPYLYHQRTYTHLKGDEPWDAPYMGAVTVVLAFMALPMLLKPGRQRALLIFSGLCIVTGMVACMGQYGGLSPIFSSLPLLNKLRSPARYIALAQFGVAVWSAVALHRLVQTGSRKGQEEQWYSWLLPALPAMAAVGLVFFPALAPRLSLVLDTPRLSGQLMPSTHMLFGAALFILAAALAVLAKAPFMALSRRRMWAVWGLALLAMGDMGIYSLRHKPAQTMAEYMAEIPMPPLAPSGRIDSDIHPTYLNRYGLAGHRGVYGYVSLYPDRALDYTQEGPLRLAGVQWREARHTASPALNAAKERGETWVALENSLPKAWLVPSLQESDDPAGDLEGISPENVVLVPPSAESGPLPESVQRGDAGSAEITSERPGEITVQVAAPDGGYLVLAESYHEGWRAEGALESLAIMRAYGDFMACAVPVGEYTVTFTFTPESYHQGRRISVLFVGISAGIILAFYAWWRYREADKTE